MLAHAVDYASLWISQHSVLGRIYLGFALWITLAGSLWITLRCGFPSTPCSGAYVRA